MTQENNYCRIYLVRHGHSEGNEKKIVGGLNHDLTAEGEFQASRKKRELEQIKFDAVFSSDLLRARRTAQIITADRQLAVNTTDLLRERFFGDWEEKLEKDILEENEHLFKKLDSLSEAEKRSFKFNETYESGDEVVSRYIRVLREIAVTYLEKTVLVTGHASAMRSFLMHIGFGSYDELPSGCIDNLAHILLESDGVDFFIKETQGVHKKAL